jgi:hypothetical protein
MNNNNDGNRFGSSAKKSPKGYG